MNSLIRVMIICALVFPVLAQDATEPVPQRAPHEIPAPALKMYDKGRIAAAAGNRREALLYFRKAVALDPKFAAACNDLGAIYLAEGEFSLAVELFRKALAVAPLERLPLTNLSIALMRMNRVREAGEAARRALEVDPGHAGLHLILAASLIAEADDTAEALDHLERAAAQIPRAHLLAADVLLKAGRREEAMDHLKEYLRIAAPQDAGRAGTEARLAELRREQPH